LLLFFFFKLCKSTEVFNFRIIVYYLTYNNQEIRMNIINNHIIFLFFLINNNIIFCFFNNFIILKEKKRTINAGRKRREIRVINK
jgi:hypothetical protein